MNGIVKALWSGVKVQMGAIELNPLGIATKEATTIEEKEDG